VILKKLRFFLSSTFAFRISMLHEIEKIRDFHFVKKCKLSNEGCRDLHPIHLKQVRRTRWEKLFNSLISEHHYLGYTQPVGEHLKYVAFSNDRPIACLAWSSAPWYIGVRDRFIGWSPETRQRNLSLIINNTRFLVLPWVEVPHLASHMLALNRRQAAADWSVVYNHPVYLLETFVDTERFQGTCYKADNWIYVGNTTGRGKLSKSTTPTLSKKAVYVYPLAKDFRRRLCTAEGRAC
jgi:hypothetical protein